MLYGVTGGALEAIGRSMILTGRVSALAFVTAGVPQLLTFAFGNALVREAGSSPNPLFNLIVGLIVMIASIPGLFATVVFDHASRGVELQGLKIALAGRALTYYSYHGRDMPQCMFQGVVNNYWNKHLKKWSFSTISAPVLGLNS